MDKLTQLAKRWGRDLHITDMLANRGGYFPSIDRVRGILEQNNAYLATFVVPNEARRVGLNLAFYDAQPMDCCDCLFPQEQNAIIDILGGRVVNVFGQNQIPPFHPNQAVLYIPPAITPISTTTVVRAASPSGFLPSSPWGIPLSSSGFGISSSVNLDGDRTTVRWEFDLGVDYRVCSFMIVCDGGFPNPGPRADGHPFTPPGYQPSYYRLNLIADGVVVGTAEQIYAAIATGVDGVPYLTLDPPTGITGRVWGLEYDVQLGEGGFDGFHYIGGLNIRGFVLYADERVL